MDKIELIEEEAEWKNERKITEEERNHINDALDRIKHENKKY